MNLAQYQGKNRILLVFAPTASDPRLGRQQNALEKGRHDLADRDIVVITVLGANEVRLRNQFRVGPSEFAVVLIGKDGGEKHRWGDAAPVDQIDYVVDRMPMRKAEMRAKQSATARSAP